MAHSCRVLGARLAASHAIPAASRWCGAAFRACLRVWQANLALNEAHNEAMLRQHGRSTAQPCGQYPAKVGVLGSALALPNPFIMMGKGSEEVSDLLGARALHVHVHPHALCRAPQGSKAHARHVEPKGSNGAGLSTATACKSGMRGATGAEVWHMRWFDDPGCHGAMHGRAQLGCGEKRATRAGRAGGAGARLEEVLHGTGNRGSGRDG